MADSAEVIKNGLQRKSILAKIKNKLQSYKTHSLRRAAKLFDIKSVGRKYELLNKINNHLNNNILLKDIQIQLEHNAKRRDDKKSYTFSINPDLKTGLENEIIKKNKTVSCLRNQFNTIRNKDNIERN